MSQKALEYRFGHTLELLNDHLPKGSRILDLGVPNALSARMREEGYQVENTGGENLDDDQRAVKRSDVDAVTAFEIFEHLLAPYNTLKAIEAPVLIATVPLRLWFKDAYWNEKDPWDCHYHEFEPKQFLMLLERSGWKVKQLKYWKDKAPVNGIRPLLRRFVPRYMGVVCVRM